jgi:hypothetical protein
MLIVGLCNCFVSLSRHIRFFVFYSSMKRWHFTYIYIKKTLGSHMNLPGSRVDWVFPGQILGWFFLKPSPVLVLGRPVGTDFKTMIFWSKTFKKYSKNLGKPTCNLQKHKRLASKPKINPKTKKIFMSLYLFFRHF